MASLYVVSYDLPDDRRRTKLAHALKDFGDRVHYSVFECFLEEDGLARLRAKVGTLIEPEEDSVRIYRLCAACRESREVHGAGCLSEDPDVRIV